MEPVWWSLYRWQVHAHPQFPKIVRFHFLRRFNQSGNVLKCVDETAGESVGLAACYQCHQSGGQFRRHDTPFFKQDAMRWPAW